ncbi:NADH:ubiquinone oxidoreductase, Nuo subunit E subfamily [Brachyspira pilosicoli 95/1000]|uniref:NADH:ubiquinone oxidoreductase, Nuo subunit E subfamily n=1 Tax=Brachyspira pilosicoli (strain ATCC BAA-1826 / 95/1000) TaxID=759914 RepID=D8IEV7_BRAP9|nr:NADH:ubiquinone oxidoreductase, Nuo subunit E subfamily [Brachyspira pilosicoli 95/1000]
MKIGIPSYDGMLLKEVECMHNCNNAISVLINGIECNDSSFGSVIKYIEAVHVKVR